MVRKQLLWSRGLSAPLIIMIPGGTGTCKSEMPGFPASAGFFWLRGFSCYIAETEGQDGNPGTFSLVRCLNECREAIETLQKELLPKQIILYGSCSGGTVATHLAVTFRVSQLFLWETLPRYDQSLRKEFAERATERVILSERFFDEYLETVDCAHEVTCPVFCMYGHDGTDPVFTRQHLSELQKAFTSASSFTQKEFKGASHNLTKGSDPALLLDLLNYMVSKID